MWLMKFVHLQSHWDLSSKYLRQICRALQLSKPPPNITAEMLFTKLESQARAAVSKSKHGVGTPLLKSNLSEQQWVSILARSMLLNFSC